MRGGSRPHGAPSWVGVPGRQARRCRPRAPPRSRDREAHASRGGRRCGISHPSHPPDRSDRCRLGPRPATASRSAGPHIVGLATNPSPSAMQAPPRSCARRPVLPVGSRDRASVRSCGVRTRSKLADRTIPQQGRSSGPAPRRSCLGPCSGRPRMELRQRSTGRPSPGPSQHRVHRWCEARLRSPEPRGRRRSSGPGRCLRGPGPSPESSRGARSRT